MKKIKCCVYAIFNVLIMLSLLCSCSVSTSIDGLEIVDNKLVSMGSCDSNEITIPSNITTIAYAAFKGRKSLESITIPSSVSTIETAAFADCINLKSVIFEEDSNIVSIGSTAFRGCSSLKNIKIPSSVTDIGFSVFEECDKLIFNKYDNGLYLGNNENPYVILVKSTKTNIQSIKINENTLFIHSKAFMDCTKVNEIIIPNSVLDIGERAFLNCENLKSISIPKNVVKIGACAFYACVKLSNVIFEEGNKITNIEPYTFYGCDFESFEIPYNVENIEEYAFYACDQLTSIVIPENVKKINAKAFIRCSGLTNIKVNENNTVYDSRENSNSIIETATNTVVLGCKNTILVDSIIGIGDYAFYFLEDIKEIKLPSNIKNIGKYSFSGCEGLESIFIPTSLMKIDYNAFSGCKKVKFYYFGTNEDWGKIDIHPTNPYIGELYYYSQETPIEKGNYWYYNENNNIVIW